MNIEELLKQSRETDEIIRKTCTVLQCSPEEMVSRIENLVNDINQIKEQKSKLLKGGSI